MNWSTPENMTPAERLAELGELLARGIQRILVPKCKPIRRSRKSRDHLDDVGDVEAQCGPFRMEATT